MLSPLTRSVAALLIALLLQTTIATAAAAASAVPALESFSFAERGLTAQAQWDRCDGPDAEGVTRCSMTQAYLFDGRQRSKDSFGRNNGALTYLCVYLQQVAFTEDGSFVDPPIAEQGCVDDPAITVRGTLDSVTASVPALELTREVCDFDPEAGEGTCVPGAIRTASVDVTFVGTGPVIAERWQSKSRSIIDGVRCRYTSSGSGISREARASITVDGSTLDPSDFARLWDGKTRFAQRCR